MSYNLFRPVIVIPAENVKQVNSILERNGYGPNNITREVVVKSEVDSKKPSTYYVLECNADEGFLAAVNLALNKVANSTIVVNVKPTASSVVKFKTELVLESLNLKLKSTLDASSVED